MINKHVSVSYTLILVSVITVILSSTFLDLERVWADDITKTISVEKDSQDNAYDPANNGMHVTRSNSNIDPVMSTTILPPTKTTIISSTVGNEHQVNNVGFTLDRFITFHIMAKQGTYPIAGFECSLDDSVFTSCTAINPGVISYDDLTNGHTHKFEVRAIDDHGNVDLTPATFSWTVLTLKQGIQKLADIIDKMHLFKTITISLDAPLQVAMKLINYHQDLGTCYTMNIFLNTVNTDYIIGKITNQQYVNLKQHATYIQHSLDCYTLLPQPLTDIISGEGMIGSLITP